MSEIVYPIFRVFSIGKNANVPHSFDTDADDRNRTQKSDRLRRRSLSEKSKQ